MLGSAFPVGRVLLVGLVLSVESVHPVRGKGVMGNDGLCLRSDHAGRDDPQERIERQRRRQTAARETTRTARPRYRRNAKARPSPEVQFVLGLAFGLGIPGLSCPAVAPEPITTERRPDNWTPPLPILVACGTAEGPSDQRSADAEDCRSAGGAASNKLD